MKLFISTVLFFAAVTANATVIDFTSEAAGNKANGYTVSGVQFFDTMDSNLDVQDYSHQSHGNALAVRNDDKSQLRMVFSGVSSNLSFEFGNDDAGYSQPGDLAYLTLFLNGNTVGSTSVLMNRDDYMNQTISLLGINFDEAVFGYVNSSFIAINLIEVIDNISFDRGQVSVPESSAIVLFMIGLLGLGLSRRRLKV